MKEKELDLDELHQAVSQMMDKGGKAKAKPEPVSSKMPPRPPVKVSERPTGSPSATATPDRGETIAVRRPAATRIAPKKRGMAMDVIQTAKPSVVTPPSARPSRTGAALQPTSAVAPEPVQPKLPAPEVKTDTAPPSSSDVSEDTLASLDMQKDGFARPKTVVEETPKPHPAVKSTFPDPLDVHGFNDNTKPEAPSDPVTEAPKAETEPTNTWDPLLDETPEPQAEIPAEQPQTPAPELSATPFVNAKVEKRPLGAFASHTSTTLEPPMPVVSESPVEAAPPENNAADTSDTSWELPATDQPAAEAASSEVPAPENTPDAPDAQTSLDHLRNTSIPPQYHAAEKEPIKVDRPIFDTKNYHTPIEAHATPRRASGSHAGIMLTVILIILLIAAGVAAYFVATGGIDLQKLF